MMAISLLTKLKSIGIILTDVVYFDYKIWRMDFKTMFLNGVLSEDVYMIQPVGFGDPENAGKV